MYQPLLSCLGVSVRYVCDVDCEFFYRRHELKKASHITKLPKGKHSVKGEKLAAVCRSTHSYVMVCYCMILQNRDGKHLTTAHFMITWTNVTNVSYNDTTFL